MKLLVVCLGNICRSPMAEGILRKIITEQNLNIEVDSAGTSDYHVGEHPDTRAIATAKKFGIDISSLRGRQFTTTDFDKFDRIYAMDRENYKNILSLARNVKDKEKVYYFYFVNNEGMDVPDPWFDGHEGFTPVFKLLENLSEQVIEDLK